MEYKSTNLFSKVNFKQYSENRKDFYEKLSQFNIDGSQINKSIEIGSDFLEKINSNFKTILSRRLEKNKLTVAENKEYKNLIRKIFPSLEPIFLSKGPTVYWFKINYSNGLTNEKILNHYSEVKKSGTGWWTQVNLARKNISTEILYLGKIETAFQNRFIQHIGLGHDFTTSLKLQRWMPSLKDMTLTFNFINIGSEWEPYLEDIEKVLWEECKPLLGANPRF